MDLREFFEEFDILPLRFAALKRLKEEGYERVFVDPMSNSVVVISDCYEYSIDVFALFVEFSSDLKTHALDNSYEFGFSEGENSLYWSVEVMDEFKHLEKFPKIKESILGYPVMGMDECFKGCSNMKEIPEIPSSVVYIYDCFNGCGFDYDYENRCIKSNNDDAVEHLKSISSTTNA